MAHGTGFGPNGVILQWDEGGGTTVVTARPDGTFDVSVVVLPHTTIGTRLLSATGGGAAAAAPFLVVPGSQQPAGFLFRR
jgi:hypothetical protein